MDRAETRRRSDSTESSAHLWAHELQSRKRVPTMAQSDPKTGPGRKGSQEDDIPHGIEANALSCLVGRQDGSHGEQLDCYIQSTSGAKGTIVRCDT
jgi:hypothetical protein